MTRRVDPLIALPFAVEQMFHAEYGTPHERKMARQRVRRLIARATPAALDAEHADHLNARIDVGRRSRPANAAPSTTHTGDTT